MQLPSATPALIVSEHSANFGAVFENRCQFRHFDNYLTGWMVLENKSMANMTRCLLDSVEKNNLSRFLSEANWDVGG